MNTRSLILRNDVDSEHYHRRPTVIVNPQEYFFKMAPRSWVEVEAIPDHQSWHDKFLVPEAGGNVPYPYPSNEKSKIKAVAGIFKVGTAIFGLLSGLAFGGCVVSLFGGSISLILDIEMLLLGAGGLILVFLGGFSNI